MNTTNESSSAVALSRIDPTTLQSTFVQSTATKSLRICCYGSSSSDTPELYLIAARSLGYILAKRGHICVNGAGAYGCMAAMNDGATIGDGHIVGVIHEMWLKSASNVRDGGAHPIFLQSTGTSSTENAASLSATTTLNASTTTTTATTPSNPTTTTSSSSSSSSSSMTTEKGGKYEMYIARGNDLQERKRMLVDKADALIVLPGGPGTWDELWEMVCARGIGLSSIPIVCINCNGYYNPFSEMLIRAYNDKMTKYTPDELIHFEDTAEAAVQWIEAVICNNNNNNNNNNGTLSPQSKLSLTKKSSLLRKSSILHSPLIGNNNNNNNNSWTSWISSSSSLWTTSTYKNNKTRNGGDDSFTTSTKWIQTTILVTTGITIGATITNFILQSIMKTTKNR